MVQIFNRALLCNIAGRIPRELVRQFRFFYPVESRAAICVSEPDLQAALDHLRALPYSSAESTPRAWDRQRLIVALQQEAHKGALNQVGDMQSIGPGVWALVAPLGADLKSEGEMPNGLQVWLLIRHVGTNPSALTAL